MDDNTLVGITSGILAVFFFYQSIQRVSDQPCRGGKTTALTNCQVRAHTEEFHKEKMLGLLTFLMFGACMEASIAFLTYNSSSVGTYYLVAAALLFVLFYTLSKQRIVSSCRK